MASEPPPDAAALAQRGHELAAARKFEAAIDQFRRADQLHIEEQSSALDRALVQQAWADTLMSLGQYEEAAAKYDEVVRFAEQGSATSSESAETRATAFHDRGVALTYLGRYDEAYAAYAESIRLFGIDDASAQARASVRRTWGLGLVEQAKYKEAIEQYELALALYGSTARPATLASLHASWGFAWSQLREFDKAVAEYEKAIGADPKSNVWLYLDKGAVHVAQGRFDRASHEMRNVLAIWPNDPYALNNLAFYLGAQGDYAAAKTAWKTAREAYANEAAARAEKRDASFFLYYGVMLLEQFGDLDAAQAALERGLSFDDSQTSILLTLGQIHLERQQGPTPRWTRSDKRRSDLGAWRREARECFSRAERQRMARIRPTADFWSLVWAGRTFLATENWAEARKHLEKAHELDPASDAVWTNLGVALSRLEEYPRAAELFTKAHQSLPHDLEIWSNLAEVYLKQKKIDRAEKEFKSILAIARDHIDSQVGLGEVYTAMADDGDDELYDVAIKHFDEALSLAKAGTGSKRVKPRERAAILYSRAYACVKAHEAGGPLQGDALLRKAYRDFKLSAKLDPDHHRAARACRTVAKRVRWFSPGRLGQVFGQALILGPTYLIGIVATIMFFWKWPQAISFTEWVSTIVGVLIFGVIGLFLPQITKLKGGGIEVEKSVVNQITSSGSLGISK
jgi:tetratricopeptide (TPR) repeat protein